MKSFLYSKLYIKSIMLKIWAWETLTYIVIQRQTVSLCHNPSVWLDTEDACSWDRNPPNFMFKLLSYCSANKRTTSVRELLGIMLSLPFVYIVALLDTRCSIYSKSFALCEWQP